MKVDASSLAKMSTQGVIFSWKQAFGTLYVPMGQLINPSTVYLIDDFIKPPFWDAEQENASISDLPSPTRIPNLLVEIFGSDIRESLSWAVCISLIINDRQGSMLTPDESNIICTLMNRRADYSQAVFRLLEQSFRPINLEKIAKSRSKLVLLIRCLIRMIAAVICFFGPQCSTPSVVSIIFSTEALTTYHS